MSIEIKRDGETRWHRVGEGDDNGEVSPEELAGSDIADSDLTGDAAQHILVRDGVGAERHLSDITQGILHRQNGPRNRGETTVYVRGGIATETGSAGLGGGEAALGVNHAFGGSSIARFMAGAEAGGAFNRNGAYPVGSTTGNASLNGVLLNGIVGTRLLVNGPLSSVDLNFVLGGEIVPNGGQTFEVRTPATCSGSDTECRPTGSGGQTGQSGVPQEDGPGGRPRLVPGTVGSLRLGGRFVGNFVVARDRNDSNALVLSPYVEAGGRMVLDRYNALVVQGGVIVGWVHNPATTTSSAPSRSAAQEITTDNIGVSEDGHLTFDLARDHLPDHSSSEAVRGTTTHIAFPLEDGRRPTTTQPSIETDLVSTTLPNNLVEGTTILVRQGRTTVPYVVTAELAQRFNGEAIRAGDDGDVTLSPQGGATFANGDTIQQLRDGVPIDGSDITNINPENGSFTIPADRLASGVNGFRVIHSTGDERQVVQQSRMVTAQSEIAPTSGNYETDIPSSIGDLTGFHVYDGAGHEIQNATLNGRHLTIPQAFFNGDGPWTVRVSRTPTSQPAYMINFVSPALVDGNPINGRDGSTYIVQANNPANFILDDPSGVNNLGTVQADQARNYAVEFIGADGRRIGNRIQLTSAPQTANTPLPLQITNDQLRTAGITNLTPGEYRLRIIATDANKRARPIDLRVTAMNRPFGDPLFLRTATRPRNGHPEDAWTYADDAIRIQFPRVSTTPATSTSTPSVRVALRLVDANGTVLQHPAGESATGPIVTEFQINAGADAPTAVLTRGRPPRNVRGEARNLARGDARVQWAILGANQTPATPTLQWRNINSARTDGPAGTIIVGGRAATGNPPHGGGLHGRRH